MGLGVPPPALILSSNLQKEVKGMRKSLKDETIRQVLEDSQPATQYPITL